MSDDLKIVVEAEVAAANARIESFGKRLDEMVAKAEHGSPKAGAAVEQMSSRIVQSLENAARSALKFTAAIGALAGGVSLGMLTRKAVELQTAMSDFGTLLGEGAKQLDQWNDAVRRMSVSTGKDPVDLARGLYQAVSAGIPATMGAGGALEFLNVAQKAATAGMATMKDTVTVGALAMNTFGTAAGSSTEVFDALQTVVKNGVTRFPELATSLGNVATIASQSGVKFKDMLAAITVLTKNGLSASEATNALRAAVQAIAAPTEEARRLFKAFHIEYGQASIEAKGLGGVITEIIDKTGGNALALRKLIPEVNGLTAAQILGKHSSRDFKEAQEQQAQASGAVAEAAKVHAMDVEKAWNRLKESVAGKFTEVWDGLRDSVVKAMDQVGKAVQAINKADLKDITKNLGTLVEMFAKTAAGAAWTAKLIAQASSGKAGDAAGSWTEFRKGSWAEKHFGGERSGTFAAEDYTQTEHGGLFGGTSSAGRKMLPGQITDVDVHGYDVSRAPGAADQASLDAGRANAGYAQTIAQQQEFERQQAAGQADAENADRQARADYTIEQRQKGVGTKAQKKAETAGRLGRKEASEAEKRKQDLMRTEEEIFRARQELSRRTVALMVDEEQKRSEMGLSGKIIAAAAHEMALAALTDEEKAEKKHAEKASALEQEKLTKDKASAQAHANVEEALAAKLLGITANYAKQRFDIEEKTQKRRVDEEKKAEEDRKKAQREAHERLRLFQESDMPRRLGAMDGISDRSQVQADRMGDVGAWGVAFAQGGVTGLAEEAAGRGLGKLGHSGAYNISTGLGRISGDITGGSLMGAGEIFLGAVQLAGVRFATFVADAGRFLADKFMGLVSVAANTNSRLVGGATGFQRAIYFNNGSQQTGAIGEQLQQVNNLAQNMPGLMHMLPGLIRDTIGPQLRTLIPQIIQAFTDGMPKVIDALMNELPRLTDALIGKLPDLMGTLAEQGAVVIGRLIQSAAQKIGPLVVALAEGIGKAIGGLIKDALSGKGLLSSHVAQGALGGAVVGSAIGAAGGPIGMGAGAAIGAGIGFLADQFHDGGIVPELQHFAMGGLVAQQQRAAQLFRDARAAGDTVPAMLTPGEMVVPADVTRRMLAGGVGQAPTVNVMFQGRGGYDSLLESMIAQAFVNVQSRQGGKARTAAEVTSGADPFLNFPPPATLLGF